MIVLAILLSKGRISFSAMELPCQTLSSYHYMPKSNGTSLSLLGTKGGIVVQWLSVGLWSEREFKTYRRRVVSLSKTLYSQKVLVNSPGSGGSVPA